MMRVLQSIEKPLVRKTPDGKLARSGVVSKQYVEINGARQGMIIEDAGGDRPVLLFLHGLGFPAYPMMVANDVRLEEHFTVCYWEQRGAGMSFDPKRAQDVLTVDDAVADAVQVAQYLRSTFSNDTILLMGHSWGTFLGSQVVQQAPEHFSGYVGIGQIGSAQASEKETYDFLVASARQRGDDRALKELASVPYGDEYYLNRRYGNVRAKYLEKYGGGTRRSGYSMSQLFGQIMRCPVYSFPEKLNFFRGMEQAARSFLGPMATSDLTQLVPELEVPVFVLHGRYDYQTSHAQAERFFRTVSAPYKRFFTFENSAHTPHIEEQARFYEVLEHEVLPHRSPGGAGRAASKGPRGSILG